MRPVRAVVLTALLALGTAAPAAADTCAEPHSWVAGSVDLCDGTLVYGDYVDDDYGADTGQRTTSHTASLAPTAGDQGYPEGEEATADLVRLTLRVEGDRLRVTGLMNALYKPDSTVLAVAIDTDGDELTGGGKWGDLDVSSRGWDRFAAFDRGDPATNAVEGTMPLPPGDRWRVQAVTAIKGSGQVMNVAFRGVDEDAGFRGNDASTNTAPDKGSWFEDHQARSLKLKDVSEFGATVDVADLRGGVTRRQPLTTGLHERVYESAYSIAPGEGRNEAGVPGRGNGGGAGVPVGFEQTFQYLGRFQPYGVYIPQKPGPHGMQMVFHGSSSVMSGLVNQPGMQKRFGEEFNRVIVVPEARGQNGFGSDVSERDLLDVMDDVEATYAIDREHVVAGGYSQGGYITYRMAALHPDRFAGGVDWVGFTGDDENGTPAQGQGYTAGAIGNMVDFVGNLRWVPMSMLYAGADELVHANTAVAMDEAFQKGESVFTFYTHPAAEHLTFAALDDWRKEAADSAPWSLVHDPPRVTFRTAAFLDDPDHRIVHDRAYWLSEIRGREAKYIDVDLTTYGCGGSVPVLESGQGSGPDPVPWQSDFHRQTGTRPIDKRPALEGTLSNAGSVQVDAARTCLDGRAMTYKLTTDGPADVALTDGRTIHLAGQGTHEGHLAAKPLSAAGRACVSRRTIRLHVRRPRGMRVRKLTILVNGKRRRTIRGRRARRRALTVSLRGLPKGRVRVTVVVRGTRKGKRRIVRDTRRYRTCNAR